MTITEGLVAEHNIFLALFEEIEDLLRELTTVTEVSALAKLLKGTLEKHADNETQLAYLVLDHKLAESGTLDRMHADHEELDANLLSVHKSATVEIAKKRLRLALLATRRHFRQEEQNVFPLIDRTLEPETLKELGSAWLRQSNRPILRE